LKQACPINKKLTFQQWNNGKIVDGVQRARAKGAENVMGEKNE